MDLPEDGSFFPEQGPSLLIHSLLTYETGWSKQAPPGFMGGLETVCVAGSPSVVPGLVARSVLEMQTLSLIPDLLHQKLLG